MNVLPWIPIECPIADPLSNVGFLILINGPTLGFLKNMLN